MSTPRSTRPVSYKFVDSRGNLRDKVVNSGRELKSTCFDGSSFGFCKTSSSDLLLVPDITSEHYDPIRNMRGVFCFICQPNGEPLEGDFRTQAKAAMDFDSNTRSALFGVEPEFFVCKRAGGPTDLVPIDIETLDDLKDEEQYKWYGCLPPLDSFQWLRDKIADNLEPAGIHIEAIHHEVAPGQCEFSWKCGSLLKIADQMLLFKYIVTATCAHNGFVADFRAKPFEKLNGSGCHVHQSLPMMKSTSERGKTTDGTKYVEAYAKGLVAHYDELLAVCCVGNTSADRLVPGYEAPTKDNNGWGWHDRTKTVRIPGTGGRVEYRLPDPEMNPYVALTLMLKYGYEEIRKLNE